MIFFSEKTNTLISWIQFRIDTTDYFFDTPKFDYQPIPWLGINEASVRGKATIQRWNSIKKNISPKAKSLKDIGSNVGYFCLMAADKLGMQTIGIDIEERFLRLSEYARKKGDIANASFLNLLINKDTVVLLPKTDVTLCLSIWHHWVYEYGLKDATEILKQIWASTNQTLFFESGEEETKDEFKLPFHDKEPIATQLIAYLEKNLEYSKVEVVGQFEAGKYLHYQIQQKRTFFKVSRKKR